MTNIASQQQPTALVSKQKAIRELDNNQDNQATVTSVQSSFQFLRAMMRYFNGGRKDHYTTADSDTQKLAGLGWGFEAIQGYVFSQQVPGTVAVYSYFNKGIVDHFLTTDYSVLQDGDLGWELEEIAFHAFPSQIPGTIPVYRYWNPRHGDHLYTTDPNELGRGNSSWTYEGIEFYVLPS